MNNKKCEVSFSKPLWIPIEKSTPNTSLEFCLSHHSVNKQRLLKNFPCTKIMSYKHWPRHVQISQNVGIMFKPMIYRVHRRSIKRQKKPSQYSPFGSEQKLIYPPWVYVNKYKKTIQRKAMKLLINECNFLTNNVVSLKDLADESWLQKKAQIEMQKKLKKRGKVEELKQRRDEKDIFKEKVFQVMEAEIPKSLEEQLNNLIEITKEKETPFFKKEDFDLINYLKDHCITDDDLSNYDNTYLEGAVKRITGKLRKREDFNEQLEKLGLEIIADYKQNIHDAILQYIFLNIKEHQKWKSVVDYQNMCLRAPVPWHNTKLIATHFLQHNLFIGNEILRDIQDLYFSKYQDTMIIKIQDIGSLPVSAFELIPKINSLSDQATNTLIKHWLADVAEIFLEKKHAWSFLIQKGYNASTALIEKYFANVNTLLSKQLRMIVMRTLNHIRDFFMAYESGNYFEGDYRDLLFFNNGGAGVWNRRFLLQTQHTRSSYYTIAVF